jgi:hypothetical protein
MFPIYTYREQLSRRRPEFTGELRVGRTLGTMLTYSTPGGADGPDCSSALPAPSWDFPQTGLIGTARDLDRIYRIYRICFVFSVSP